MSRMRGYGVDSETRGGVFFGMGSQGSSTRVTYVCLVCNNKHKGGNCPRCGSKMQRAAPKPYGNGRTICNPILIASDANRKTK